MRLFLLPPPIVLSTLAAAGPLPHLLGNNPQARAPALSSQESSLTAPVKARSVHDAIHTDSKEGFVVLLKRDVFSDLGHIFDKFGCDVGALVGGQCGCPGVEC
ncbi:hypothetical protein HO173_005496 [Letharia columbiana]|uniref:Uncharacterized protein n=1 Tax=Letharia columbiana TaxID=112416 RepID=A0A8H6FX30_9LECA|nr:uncharacterized protein HO173_005496 [Letharia columbiana]KAF6236404.1 hypothetical protein HO173_005496 [Letharia columbiana]